MVLGNTKWTLDFSHFILNEIFDLADEFEDVFNDPEAFTQKRKTSSIPQLQSQSNQTSENHYLPPPPNPPLQHVPRLPPLHLPRPPRRPRRLRNCKPSIPPRRLPSLLHRNLPNPRVLSRTHRRLREVPRRRRLSRETRLPRRRLRRRRTTRPRKRTPRQRTHSPRPHERSGNTPPADRPITEIRDQSHGHLPRGLQLAWLWE